MLYRYQIEIQIPSNVPGRCWEGATTILALTGAYFDVLKRFATYG